MSTSCAGIGWAGGGAPGSPLRGERGVGGGERGPGHGDGEPVLRHVEGEVLPHHREAVQSDVAGHWSESGESVGGGAEWKGMTSASTDL